MKILYAIPALQHPRIRGACRHYHFVKELAREHDITLLSLVRSKVEPEVMKEMSDLTHGRLHTFNVNGESGSKLAGRAARLPLLGSYIEKNLKLAGGVNEMKATFLKLVEEEDFDVVLFHGKSIFPVIKNWKGLPIVTDFCDATSLRIWTSMRYHGLAKTPYYFYKWLCMRRLEKKMVEKTPYVAFISNRDRQAILGPDDQSEILPLGIDYDFWSRSNERFDSNTVVFTGVMDYAPNHDAAMHLLDNILPRLKERIPQIKITIVGRDPKPELLRKAEDFPEVTVTGFVEDVRPYLEQATVFAAPVRFASGSQNKVLEAMAMKVPVVATSVVADGITMDKHTEPPLLRADKDEEFVDALARVLYDRKERNRLAREAHSYVGHYFNWDHAAGVLARMCREAVENGAVKSDSSQAGEQINNLNAE